MRAWLVCGVVFYFVELLSKFYLEVDTLQVVRYCDRGLKLPIGNYMQCPA